MSFNKWPSNCIKSLLIIYSKSAKVTSRQCLGAILTSLFFRIKLFKVTHSVERKISWNFFWIFLFNKWKVWWMLSPRKIPSPKKFQLHVCSWFLSNMFKSLVISFVYLTNHLTNIYNKLYTFCISPVQSDTITSKQLSATRCSNVIVLLCIAETERVQNLMKTLARTNFKSI